MRIGTSALLAIALLVVAACGGGGSGGSPGAMTGSGKLNIFVTDSPFPFQYVESATVVINEVRIHDEDGGGWVTVFEGSEEIDLVPLTGGVTQLLTQVDLEPGTTFDQVRLIVDAGEVVLTEDAFVNGDSHTFTTELGNLLFPSGSQTGIKVNIDVPIEVVTQLSADLVLDFDLSKNFVFNGPVTHAPGVRRVLFTPVVRATNETVNGRIVLDVLSDAGTDETTDDVPLPGASVTATDVNGVEAGSGVTDAEGHLELILPPGTYDLLVEATDHESQTVLAVPVALGNATVLPPITLAATMGTITGTVRGDNGTGDPLDDVLLEGVLVSAQLQGSLDAPTTTTTGADGRYALTLPLGTYDLTFTHAGYADLMEAGVAATFAGTVKDVTLAAVDASISGTVLGNAGTPDPGDDAALVGVLVSAQLQGSGDPPVTTTTGVDGTYSLALAPGTYDVTFSLLGYVSLTVPGVVATTSGATQDATLEVE